MKIPPPAPSHPKRATDNGLTFRTLIPRVSVFRENGTPKATAAVPGCLDAGAGRYALSPLIQGARSRADGISLRGHKDRHAATGADRDHPETGTEVIGPLISGACGYVRTASEHCAGSLDIPRQFA